MNYLRHAAGLAAFVSFAIAVVAVLGLVFGVVAVAAAGSFLVLFPLVLLTLPAIKSAALTLNEKLRVKMKAYEDAYKAGETE